MQILISFIPWIAFWVLLKMHWSEPAALAGFLLMLLLVVLRRLKKRPPKLLELLTLSYFFLLTILAVLTDLERFSRWIHVGGSLLLLLLTSVLFLFRKPFTLQYAREMVPRESWDSPGFIRLNYVISWVWFAVFLLFFLLAINRPLELFVLPRWLDLTVIILCIVAASRFTRWYSSRAGIIPARRVG